MELAGFSGVYEMLLVVLVIILIFNGVKRQKIMNKVDSNLSQNSSHRFNQDKPREESKIKEGEYIEFEETTD